MPKVQTDAEKPNDRQVRDTVLRYLTGYRLKRAYMKVQPTAQKALAEEGLRVISFSCLSAIVDNPGIVQFELADTLQMERSNLVVVIDELESRELISRERVPTDRRRYALTATLQGRLLRDRAAKKAAAAEQGVLAALAEDEQEALRDLLERIARKTE